MLVGDKIQYVWNYIVDTKIKKWTTEYSNKNEYSCAWKVNVAVSYNAETLNGL